MLVLYIPIIAIAVGVIFATLASKKKLPKRTWTFVLAALVGAFLAGFFSMGDMPFLMKYGRYFNPMTMPIIGAVVAAGLVWRLVGGNKSV